jgi:pSer/pThr/pTyr-binding forkhead associated (FHA) protein
VKAVDEMSFEDFPFVIGRRKDCDGFLPLVFISRRHCQFLLQEDQLFVQDLESYNGTFVNGRRASLPLPVENGDEVSLGPISFRVALLRGMEETRNLATAKTCEEMERLDPAIE